MKKINIIIVHGIKPLSSGKINSFFINRLDKAIEITNREKIDLIVISGGKTVKHSSSEAQIGANYLKNKLFSKTKLVLEENSRTTFENVLFTKSLVKLRYINKIYVIGIELGSIRMRFLYYRIWPELYNQISFMRARVDKKIIAYFWSIVNFFYLFFILIDPQEKYISSIVKKIFRNA